MDDAFLIIAVGLSLRNSTLPSWMKLPLSQVNVGTTVGCVLHFSLLWLLPDALVTIAVLLFSVLLRCEEGVWVIPVSAAYMMFFYLPTEGFCFAPRPALVLFPWSQCPTDLLVGTVPCPSHPCGAWQVAPVSTKQDGTSGSSGHSDLAHFFI